MLVGEDRLDLPFVLMGEGRVLALRACHATDPLEEILDALTAEVGK